MVSILTFTVEIADWARDEAILCSIRKAVFVVEQNVPIELEWDGLDPDCTHVIAYSSKRTPVGTARLQNATHIGRMAVLPEWRKQGVGGLLLQKLIAVTHARGAESVELNAQRHAVAFYERFGFVAEGAEFNDAGIPHRQMRLVGSS